MLPVIALIGRPNVGKSTLFNRLTKSRDALVADLPGLTRDRQYGEGSVDCRRFIVVDTGGIGVEEKGLGGLMLEQARQALKEADAVLFVVDGRVGRTAADEVIAAQLRLAKKNIYLVVNKTDGTNPTLAMAEFHAMGLGDPVPISAAHGDNITLLMEKVLAKLTNKPVAQQAEASEEQGIKVAFIGRPNVGKSTLVNRILGEERVLVYDEAGTTRDSIFIPFKRREQLYTIIDTAGVRRRSRVAEKIEKFSVIKTLQAIETAHVVVYVIDAREGLVESDLNLLGFVLDTGTALVLAVNKWDGLPAEHKEQIKKELNRRLTFVDFARIHFISALHGTGVGDLFTSIQEAYRSSTKQINTPLINKLLEKAVHKFQPPLVHGRRIKLRYGHLGGHKPPLIVIHGNQVDALPMNYKRYLAKFFREELNLIGTPVRLQFKAGENPYQGKKNVLTKRQVEKRRRLIRHVKKS